MGVFVRIGGAGADPGARYITIDTAPTKTAYIFGETLDLTGLVVSAHYSDGTEQVINNYTTTPVDGATLSKQTNALTISWESEDGVTLTQTIPISVKFCTGISVTTRPNKVSYYSGDSCDLTGMVVMAFYSDGTTVDVSASISTAPAAGSGLDVSNNKITVSYTYGGERFEYIFPISVTYPVYTWASGTEDQISQMFELVDAGKLNLSSVWAVGDERAITMGQPLADTVVFVVLDLGNDGIHTTSGGTSFHALVGQKTKLSKEYRMNPTNDNAGGYNSSEMKTFIDGDYATSMSNATAGKFYNLIKLSTHKHQGNTGHTTATDTQTTSNVRFILPSEYEVFGVNTWSVGEASFSKQFEYYKSQANRIKNPGLNDKPYYYWWERSTYSKDTNNSYQNTCFCCVGSDGSAGFYYASYPGNGNYCFGPLPFAAI